MMSINMHFVLCISFIAANRQQIYAASYAEERLVAMEEFDVTKELCERRELSVIEA